MTRALGPRLVLGGLFALASSALAAAAAAGVDPRSAWVSASEVAEALGSALGAPGFPAGAAVAIQIDAPPAWEGAFTRDLAAALRGRLEGLGAGVIVAAVKGETGPTSAVGRGAEYLLEVQVRPDDDALEVAARVLHIDRGLWSSPSSAPPALLADARIRRALPRPGLVPGPAPGVSVDAGVGDVDAATAASSGGDQPLRLGSPTSLLSWPGPVLALACCPVDPAGERLLVLGSRELAVLDVGGARVRVVDRWSLLDQQRASAPVRAPYGALRCGRAGVVAMGHGRLAQGFELRFHPRLRMRRALDGFPVGFAPGGGWWLARVRPGRPELAPTLRGPDGAVVELEGPVREAIALGPGPSGFAVTIASALRPWQASGAFGLPFGAAGVGLSAAESEDGPWIASTSLQGPEDRVSVSVAGHRLARALPGPAQATAIGRLRGARPGIVVAVEDGPNSRLVWIPVEGPQR